MTKEQIKEGAEKCRLDCYAHLLAAAMYSHDYWLTNGYLSYGQYVRQSLAACEEKCKELLMQQA